MGTPKAGHYLYTTATCYRDNRPCLTREEKLKKIADIRAEIDRWRDPCGKKVDEGIKETLIALNAMGIHTTSSCEGHIDSGLPKPLIQIENPEVPIWQFVGQKEAFEKVAEKYRISLHDVRYATNEDAWSEAVANMPTTEETPEFREWSEKNQPLLDRIGKLVEEFNVGRGTPRQFRLTVKILPGNGAHLMALGHHEWAEDRRRVSAEKLCRISGILAKHQAEMKAFTEFLMKKYLE